MSIQELFKAKIGYVTKNVTKNLKLGFGLTSSSLTYHIKSSNLYFSVSFARPQIELY